MPVEVEVALIGDPERPMEAGVLDQPYFDMPYSQRRRVRFEANEDESLASVMERAAQMMGLVPPDWMGGQFYGRGNRIAFYKPEDEDGFAPRAAPRSARWRADHARP